jgi:hypothetical protein
MLDGQAFLDAIRRERARAGGRCRDISVALAQLTGVPTGLVPDRRA